MKLTSEQMNLFEFAIYGDYGYAATENSKKKAAKQLK